jgi:CRP-like cAMP-binding protein
MTVECKSGDVRSLNIFHGLSEVEYDAACTNLAPQPVFLKEGRYLIAEGEQTDLFWYVNSGQLGSTHYHYDGNCHLVEIFQKGDPIGLDTVCTVSRRSPVDIEALTDAALTAFDFSALRSGRLAITTLEKIQRNIMWILADENIRKHYKIDILSKRSLRMRILIFLYHMRRRAGLEVFEIEMDREQMAQYLGVNRSALSHELSLMRQEGLIEFRKQRFQIKNGTSV